MSRVIGGVEGHFLITEHHNKKKLCPEEMSGVVDHYLWWSTFRYPNWKMGDNRFQPPIEEPIPDAQSVQRLRDIYVALAQERRLIVKNPANVLRVPILRDMFPSARFVFCARDPWRTMQSASATDAAHDPFILRSRRVMSLPPDRLLRAAVSWEESVAAYLSSADDSWISIRYEDLVAHPADTIERLYSFLGIAATNHGQQAAALPREQTKSNDAVAARFASCPYKREILDAISSGCEALSYDPAPPQLDAKRQSFAFASELATGARRVFSSLKSSVLKS